MPVDPHLIAVLQKTISPEKHELEAAQSYLEEAARANLPELLCMLSDLLADESCDVIVRMQAGLQLKNSLYSKETNVKENLKQRWLEINAETRTYIKENCLRALATEKSGHSTAAQCVAFVACTELPAKQWPDLMSKLVNNVVQKEAADRLKLSTLEAIGYICQDIDPSILTGQANEILTAIVSGMKESSSDQVILAATNALFNSLEFTKNNFYVEAERNYIMQVVCETTQHQDQQISVAALQCLVKIMSLYYAFMESYMSRALFPITLAAMQSPVPEISLQGIEFWSNVCDEEIELALEASDCMEKGQPPSVSSKFYAKGALGFITPILMKVMTLQDDASDEQDWNPSKAASVCLMLLAQLCENDIVPIATPFITENVKSEDWKCRNAAILTFGSILEGPEPSALKPWVESAVPFIIGMMKDDSVAVRDTAAWTISRVCEVLPEVVIQPQYLMQLLEGLIQGLTAEPRVATNVCWALSNLAESAYLAAREATGDDDAEPATYCLSQYFEYLTKALLETCSRPDAAQNNLRNAAYTSLMDVLRCSAKDCYAEVQRVTVIIIERLESMLNMEQQITAQDRAQFNDLQSLLCGNLQSVLPKISAQDAPLISDKVMAALMSMLSRGHADESFSGVHEDALLAVSSLVDVLGEGFLKYLDVFMPCLVRCLSNTTDTQVCFNAIGLVGDLCRNLQKNMMPHSQGLFTLLVGVLQEKAVDKSLRPAIINVFSDFSLALSGRLDPFLQPMLEILHTATQANVDVSDPDMADYILQLRNSCLSAYTGVLHGLKEDPSTASQYLLTFQGQAQYILQFVQHICKDANINEEIIANSCGLVGDLVSAYGEAILPLVDNDEVAALLTRGRRAKSNRVRQVASWATKEIKKLQNNANGLLTSASVTSPATINVGQH